MSPGGSGRRVALRASVLVLVLAAVAGLWLVLRADGDGGADGGAGGGGPARVATTGGGGGSGAGAADPGGTTAPGAADPGAAGSDPGDPGSAGSGRGADENGAAAPGGGSSASALPRADRVDPDPAPDAPGTAYLALGDSLAQGVQRIGGRFRTTTQSYPDQLAGRLTAAGLPVTLTRLGCSGATVRSLIEGGRPCSPSAPVPYADDDPDSSQLAWAEDYLRRRGDRPTLVTIDIGANDLLACAGGSADGVRACFARDLPIALRRLRGALDRLRRAAGSRTVLAGMTYYDPAVALVRSDVLRDTGLAFHDVVRRVANPGALRVLRGSGFLVARVDRAFRSDQPADAPGVVDTTCRLTRLCRGTDFHPNAAGYGRIAGVFLDVVRGPLRGAARGGGAGR